MILYMSAGTEETYFNECMSKGVISSGFQAQKFNRLIIEGLASYVDVVAISNLPFCKGIGEKVCAKTVERDAIKYYSIGNNPGLFHKLKNILDILKVGKKVCSTNEVEGIICDSINVLMSLSTVILSRMYKVQSLAIVTDLPLVMDEKKTFVSRLDNWLLRKYKKYVLLTEQMNEIICAQSRNYIVVEGICDNENRVLRANDEKRKYCLYTGSLSEESGVDLLVRGFAEYAPDEYDLIICGSGDLDLSFADTMRICLQGSVPNEKAVELQMNASLLINPRPSNVPYGEYSFPSKLLEYMFSGTPVLTTRLPGIPSEYNDFLYWIDDDTAEGIGTSIKRVLEFDECERRNKGDKAKQFVQQNKNKSMQARRIIDLLLLS